MATLKQRQEQYDKVKYFRDRGLTLQAIGGIEGVSRERIRQILLNPRPIAHIYKPKPKRMPLYRAIDIAIVSMPLNSEEQIAALELLINTSEVLKARGGNFRKEKT